MNKDYYDSLRTAAEEAGKVFSNRTPDVSNFGGVSFAVEEIAPNSDASAAVTYLKSDGSRVVFFFYLIRYKNGHSWRYFVPTDSHVVGMYDFARVKAVVEKMNYER